MRTPRCTAASSTRSLPSGAFFSEVRQGRFNLILSPLVADELEDAPAGVRELFDEMRQLGKTVDVTEEAIRLQQAYLDANVVGPKWEADALHVAIAAVRQCRLIVSWNFRHIVNFQKIPLYNGVNLASGYGVVGIHTPQEVTAYEEEDV